MDIALRLTAVILALTTLAGSLLGLDGLWLALLATASATTFVGLGLVVEATRIPTYPETSSARAVPETRLTPGVAKAPRAAEAFQAPVPPSPTAKPQPPALSYGDLAALEPGRRLGLKRIGEQRRHVTAVIAARHDYHLVAADAANPRDNPAWFELECHREGNDDPLWLTVEPGDGTDSNPELSVMIDRLASLEALNLTFQALEKLDPQLARGLVLTPALLATLTPQCRLGFPLLSYNQRSYNFVGGGRARRYSPTANARPEAFAHWKFTAVEEPWALTIEGWGRDGSSQPTTYAIYDYQRLTPEQVFLEPAGAEAPSALAFPSVAIPPLNLDQSP
ncbi:MAG: hypothetical protein ACFCBW_17710 [Candidatus Competibacterales bacterium]